MFPTIHHLDDLRPHIVDRKEINIVTQPNGYHVVCYSISGPDTFSDPDPIKQSFLRECRGITFYPDGTIASRSLHKFFNVGEKAETQEDKLDLSPDNVARFMDKRDGSMLHPVKLLDGSIVLKTKKSFTSDVAIKATKFLHLPKNKNILEFCAKSIQAGFTPIFEYTAPDNRIVLSYCSEELRLLHYRDMVQGTYITDMLYMQYIADDWKLDLVNDYDPHLDLDRLLAEVPDVQDIEGYVIQFKDGNMVKLKTPWYIALHHVVTFTRVRDVAEMALNETVDDYKSYLTMVGATATFKLVEEIEQKVLLNVSFIQNAVQNLVANTPEDLKASRKDFAMYHKGNEYFKLIMDLYSSKEPNYKDFYRKNFLDAEFGLEQV